MNGLPKAQDDASVPVRGKAMTLQTNLVCTYGKLVGAKKTAVIGRYGSRLICLSVAERNRRLRYNRAAAVAYSPLKTRSNSRSLSLCAGWAGQKKKPYDTRDAQMARQETMMIQNHLRPPISSIGERGA
jgi:hypothetical protein